MIGQSIYQLVVTLVLNFSGRSILKSIIDFSGDDNANTVLTTVVFNTFVWMQIFNQWK
jgi:Ca2+-transporting ATPase